MRLPAILLTLPFVATATLAGQAAIHGRAVNDSTGRAVPGATVQLVSTGATVETDSTGRFSIGNVPISVGYLNVRKIGFRPVRLKAMIFGPDTLDVVVRLRPTVLELEPIEVTAAAVPPGMMAFAERRANGQGHFIDWHVLRASEHRRVSELLRSVRGVRLVAAGGNKTVATTSRGRCPMAVWLDGVRHFQPGSGQPVPNIDDYPIAQLEAIEVYRGPAETPGELTGRGAGCGTIVLWTRRQ